MSGRACIADPGCCPMLLGYEGAPCSPFRTLIVGHIGIDSLVEDGLRIVVYLMVLPHENIKRS